MKPKNNFDKWAGKIITLFFIFCLLASACSTVSTSASTHTVSDPNETDIPQMDHVVMIVFENREYTKIVGNPFMPTFNSYANNYTLLTEYYAVTHPSLPNYLAMVGGDTFGIDSNCDDCFINAPSLVDLIEASGRTWKTYQEDMQVPCGLGSQDEDE